MFLKIVPKPMSLELLFHEKYKKFIRKINLFIIFQSDVSKNSL